MAFEYVYAIVSKQGVHEIFINEEIANFYCEKIDSRIARNPKVEPFQLHKNLTSCGYRIYDDGHGGVKQ